MNCPECESKTIVVDFKRRGMKALYRRYECKNCKKRFSTLENYFVAHDRDVKPSTALEIVALELGKAKSKHPDFPYLYSERLSVIMEELGELAAAINDEEKKERIVEEAAHVAVTAIRFIENML